MALLDVIIIGGGPAGLNAAIVLARCRRRIMLFDNGHPRNRRSQGIHNYLTRDNILPRDFLKFCQLELKKYGVLSSRLTITNAKTIGKHSFVVEDEKGNTYNSRTILIATGLKDRLPNLPNIENFFGSSVFHCPYCDGWEVRDKKLGVYARNKNGFELALSLLRWSRNVTYFSDGRNSLKPGQAEALMQHSIRVVNTPLRSLIGSGQRLKKIELQNKDLVPIDALFLVNGYLQQSDLGRSLGCQLNKKNVVVTNRLQQTNVPGVYVAGDASRDMQFVVVAASEGAKAAVTINKALQKEDLKRKPGW